jgi:methylthioribose-1-phosphate isomerase
MDPRPGDTVRALQWSDTGLRLLDQRLLPQQESYLDCRHVGDVARAISQMVVRGAPAIGITAAYGAVLAARERYAANPRHWKEAIREDLDRLAGARPTAVNLSWALARMSGLIEDLEGVPVEALLAEARAIHEQDIQANHRMGELGAGLLEGGAVLTHCNTGSLATGGYGTALGVIRSGVAAGRVGAVYADETRPWLQGSRLTAWELLQDGIEVTLICDGAAAALLRGGEVGWVIVGADRIAANGDVANKIGTYGLAVNARHHGAGFMVVAPSGTVDMATPSGDAIPIESRPAREVLVCAGQSVAPQGARAWNPVFDITPAALIDVIVTERGVVCAPDASKMAAIMGGDPRLAARKPRGFGTRKSHQTRSDAI